jgi:hypothetical protein
MFQATVALQERVDDRLSKSVLAKEYTPAHRYLRPQHTSPHRKEQPS